MTHVSDQKRNVLVLAGAQALFQTSSVLTMTLAGLVGFLLATDKSLATLPVAAMMVAVAAVLIPASLVMQRYGRKAGFQIGSMLGVFAGLAAAVAIWSGSFWLFVGATMLMGGFQAFAQYYRFAAAEAADDKFRSRAISWVIAGGLVAAFAGPNIARVTQDIGPVSYIVPFLVLSALALVSMALLTRLSLPDVETGAPAESTAAQEPARSLWEIMGQKVFLTALIGSTVGFSMMIMVMTATPLAMQMKDYLPGDFATVIQWHVLAMFLPSFFTGGLIARIGVLPVMAMGIGFIAGHVAIAMSGTSFWHFLSGLVLMGLGWNFLFIGGTTLLTEAYRPAEKAKTQAAHDFLMFGAVSLASFSAGGLLERWGWDAVTQAVVPFLFIAIIAVLSLAISRRNLRLSEI